jgi:hypothetical protein
MSHFPSGYGFSLSVQVQPASGPVQAAVPGGGVVTLPQIAKKISHRRWLQELGISQW